MKNINLNQKEFFTSKDSNATKKIAEFDDYVLT